MSQVNMIIAVNIDKIQTTPYDHCEDGSFEITNPSDCIYMHDDQTNAVYKSGSGAAELNTFASPGSLVTWTILPYPIEYVTNIQIVNIEDTTNYQSSDEVRLFSEEKATIFCA